LLLPLAMPAYVVAYAYTDFLQYSGPLQMWLRQTTGLQGALWPDIRSLWGAALVLSLSLYPYVYLLARTALTERATPLMEAARLLGAPLWRRIWRLALPLARPAIAAGTALALMETLADFGVASYFGVQTFTAGIYKAWLVMDNRVAAAQLATSLLLLVALLLVVGMFLDGVSIFLIFVPLVMPLMRAYQWDPVWFGILLTMMVAVGQFTPPMAVNLMVSCKMAGVSMEQTFPWVWWLVLAMTISMLAVLFFPPLALWLPQYLGY
jgi:ABC-type Fe3+ transport system permease subunit